MGNTRVWKPPGLASLKLGRGKIGGKLSPNAVSLGKFHDWKFGIFLGSEILLSFRRLLEWLFALISCQRVIPFNELPETCDLRFGALSATLLCRFMCNRDFNAAPELLVNNMSPEERLGQGDGALRWVKTRVLHKRTRSCRHARFKNASVSKNVGGFFTHW